MWNILQPSGLFIYSAELSGTYRLLRQSSYRHLRPSSCSSPQFNAVELLRQLKMAKVTFIIAHSSNIATVLSAARLAGLPPNRVILIDQGLTYSSKPRISNVHDLIQDGIKKNFNFKERILEPGEGRRKVALLSWSSGTTGNPKAVEISHYALIANIIQMATHNQAEKALRSRYIRGFRPGDVAIGVLPFYHVAGLVISLHFTIFCAMSVVVIERYNILSTLESIVRHRITHLIIVPPLAVELCKHPAVRSYDLSAVKHMIIGAAPVAKEVQIQLCELFPDAQIGQAYGTSALIQLNHPLTADSGLTEMTTTLAMMTGTQKRGPVGSGGKLLPGVQARVIRPDGSLADYGELGALIVKGPAAALGYLNDEQACEMIKVKGLQVAPAEIEGCLLAHPDVADCCVVGVPDDYSGELPLAFVALTTEAQERFMFSADEAYKIKASIINVRTLSCTFYIPVFLTMAFTLKACGRTDVEL
ncbi:hypothetical protein DXG01_008753 [Tephrocybe rancida]|nr:hypothetical protein DXG01_008753 [Tephrocybe rancida]